LTKEPVEARKTQKTLNKEFSQLRQKDNSCDTTQAMVHSSAPQFTNPIKFSDETNNVMAIDSFTALNGLGQAVRMRTVTRGNLGSKINKILQQTYQWQSQIETTDQRKNGSPTR
jgi:hypothetical protein